MRKIEVAPEITVDYSRADDALFISFRYESEQEGSVYIKPTPVAIWLKDAITREIISRYSSFEVVAPEMEGQAG